MDISDKDFFENDDERQEDMLDMEQVECGEESNCKARTNKRKGRNSDSEEERAINETQNIDRKRIRENLNYPTNKTMNTNGIVVIIKPEGENESTFTKDPVGLATAFKNSAFSKTNYKDFRTNTRRNIATIEIETINEEAIEKLISITTFGKWKVRCYRPTNETNISGVIKNIHTTVDLE